MEDSATLAGMLPRRTLSAVLFDWDGTLLNSYHADSQAYLAVFRELGLTWGLRELDEHYSPDWYTVYAKAGIPTEQWDLADSLWRAHYLKHPSKLMNGARSVLRQLLRRHKLGLVTSGDRARVIRQLREFQLTRLFRTRVCGGDLREKKPHPAPLLLALKKMKLAAEDCVYVGDTSEDMQMAHAANVRSVGVLGPFPTEKRLRAAKPEFLLHNLSELPALLREINGKSNGSRRRP